MREVAVRADALTRDFGSTRAVDRLTLEVPVGAVFGLLGPNGSGKTTTIRMLLGLIEPTSGSATVLGFDPRTHGSDVRARCGALLEHVGLYERLSAFDNLELYGRIWHLRNGERRTRIRELLTHLGLWERRDETVARWSRGMKQKLAVARALLHRPALVVLDEPTSGLDPIAAKALRGDLATLARAEAVSVLLTTHNLAEAETLCARIAVIDKGRLLTVGSPDEVRARVASPRLEVIGRGFSRKLEADLRARRDVARVELSDRRIVIHLADGTDVAPIVGLITSSGAEVEEARRERATLEDAFIDLVEAAR